MKFRVLTGAPVTADRWLSPSEPDLRYAKRFLTETATQTNKRVGQLLEKFHVSDPDLFDAQAKANEVSQRFACPVTINNYVGVP